jgi:hypothetical protein
VLQEPLSLEIIAPLKAQVLTDALQVVEMVKQQRFTGFIALSPQSCALYWRKDAAVEGKWTAPPLKQTE